MYGRYPLGSRSSDADLLFGCTQYDEVHVSGLTALVSFAIGVLIGLMLF